MHLSVSERVAISLLRNSGRFPYHLSLFSKSPVAGMAARFTRPTDPGTRHPPTARQDATRSPPPQQLANHHHHQPHSRLPRQLLLNHPCCAFCLSSQLARRFVVVEFLLPTRVVFCHIPVASASPKCPALPLLLRNGNAPTSKRVLRQ